MGIGLDKCLVGRCPQRSTCATSPCLLTMVKRCCRVPFCHSLRLAAFFHTLPKPRHLIASVKSNALREKADLTPATPATPASPTSAASASALASDVSSASTLSAGTAHVASEVTSHVLGRESRPRTERPRLGELNSCGRQRLALRLLRLSAGHFTLNSSQLHSSS